MTGSTIRIALIYGSTREGRFCDTVVEWVVSGIAGRGEFMLDRLDPREFDLSGDAAKAELERRLGMADAFIVVTPEYNHGYPAPLKSLIDAVHEPWQAKPVAFVSYGGISGGLRAVEQLRLVFAELHAMGIRDSVSLSTPWDSLDADGRLVTTADKRKAMVTMLNQLAWWARALREARASWPYLQPAPQAPPAFYSVIDYTVDGVETQCRLIEAFAAIQEDWVRFYPGFRSATFLASLDGTRVYNLVHWASEADFRRFEAVSDNEGRAAAIRQALLELPGKAEPRMSGAPRYVVMREVRPGPRRG